MRHFITYVSILCLGFVFQSCSGGGSAVSGSSSGAGTATGATETLVIGTQLSLVDAQASSSGTQSLKKYLMAVPASGDYVTDEAEYFVYDESTKPLDMLNEILCMVDQLKYTSFVNAGPYIAMVDESECGDQKESKSQSGSSDQSSASDKQKEISKFIVDATRDSDTSPLVVKMWFTPYESNPEDFDTLEAELVIYEGKSETNKFGVFTIDMVGFLGGTQSFLGGISVSETDQGQIEAQIKMDGDIFSKDVHVIFSPEEDTGVAYVSHSMSWDGGDYEGEGEMLKNSSDSGETSSETIAVAFNPDYFLSSFLSDDDSERTSCMDRNNYYTNVWDYRLYEEDGDRVSMESGFPIKKDDAYGYADYWGVWFNMETTLASGDTLTNDDGSTNYTYFEGHGRLIKNQRNTMTLNDISGEVMTFYDWNEETMMSTEYQVTWDGTNLNIVGQLNEETWQYEPVDPAQPFDFVPYQWIGLWKEGLGTVDLLADENGEIQGDTTVPYYTEEFVDPTTAEGLSLRCAYNCPKANPTADDFTTGDLAMEDVNSDVNAMYAYTFDAESYVLKYQGSNVSIASTETIDEGGMNSWGNRSGAMVLASAQMDYPWETMHQDVTYYWEYGPNPWNRYTGLIDSDGSAVTFDAPINCLYEDDEHGTFFLNYDGHYLGGIPYEQAEVDDESSFEHWVAAFTVPDGTELSCDGQTYYVRQMMVEQFMKAADDSACSDLNVDNVETTPGPATYEYSDPEIGDRPEITDAPKVVGGEIQ